MDVLDELMRTFLTVMAPRTREMKTEQEESKLDTHLHYGGPKREYKPHFDNLLLAIAAVYEVR